MQFTGTGSHNNKYTGTYTLIERAPSAADIENNSTTLDWSIIMDATNGYYFLDWDVAVSATAGGTSLINETRSRRMSPASAATNHTLEVASGTITIPHDADGSKSISVSATITTSTSQSYLPGTITMSGTMQLTTLPRASTMTFPAVFTAGSSGTFSITRASASFSHRITYVFGNISETEAVAKTTSLGPSWAPPLTLLNQIPSAVSGTGTLKLYTYNGNTLIGSKEYTFTLQAGADVKPSIQQVTVSDAEGLFEIFGKYVLGQSKIRVQTAVTQAYSSPIQRINVFVDGQEFEGADVTTDALTNSGAMTITITATDARGRTSAAATMAYTVLPYAAPVVSAIAYRCNSSGAADEEGSYIRVGFTATISPLDNQNSATYAVKYKTSDSDVWTTASSGSGTSYTSGAILSNVDKAYNVEATVTDRITGTTKSAVIPIAFVLIDYYESGKGITFGAVATREGFDCKMRTYFDKAVDMAGVTLPDSTQGGKYLGMKSDGSGLEWKNGGGGGGGSVEDVLVNNVSVVDGSGVARVSVPTSADDVGALPVTNGWSYLSGGVPNDNSALTNRGYVDGNDQYILGVVNGLIPTHTAAQNGLYLGVDTNGNLVWKEAQAIPQGSRVMSAIQKALLVNGTKYTIQLDDAISSYPIEGNLVAGDIVNVLLKNNPHSITSQVYMLPPGALYPSCPVYREKQTASPTPTIEAVTYSELPGGMYVPFRYGSYNDQPCFYYMGVPAFSGGVA